MHEYIISCSTCKGVLTGLYPHSIQNVVSEFDHWPMGQAPAVIILAVPQGNGPGGTFDLCHRNTKSLYVTM